VEVIVAIGIFSLLSVGSYRVVNGMISAKEKISLHSEKMHEISRAVRIIESDFTQIIDRKVLDENGLMLPSFSTSMTNYQDDNVEIDFTRVGYRNPLFMKRSEAVRISYGYQDYLEDEDFINSAYDDGSVKNNNKNGYLMRYIWPVLDRGRDSLPRKQIVLEGISSLSAEYYASRNECISIWPPLDNPNNASADIPYAIKIKISMEDDFIIERVFALRRLPDKP